MTIAIVINAVLGGLFVIGFAAFWIGAAVTQSREWQAHERRLEAAVHRSHPHPRLRPDQVRLRGRRWTEGHVSRVRAGIRA